MASLVDRYRLLVVGLFVLVASTLIQQAGCNQTSHWLLLRALDHGTASIDPWQTLTCDKSYFEGHFYSNKAPGLAFVTLPFFALVKAIGLMPTTLPSATWVVGLWPAALAAGALLLVVWYAADLLERGTGAVVALCIGLGTLVLPFATMAFAHVLSALCLFSAFTLALSIRDDDRRIALAGFLAGFAIAVEYPNGLVAVLVGVYVLAGPARLRGGLIYAAGAAIPVAGALVYNLVVWGSPTHMPQNYGVVSAGQSGHDVVLASQVGGGTFFGISAPSLDGVAQLVGSGRGLLIATPLVAVALAALPLAWRRGHRAEALLVAAIVVVSIIWNAGFQAQLGNPLGGDVPGPRYLVPILPFLSVPLASAFRVAPRVTGLLAAVSAATMILATTTQPLLGTDHTSDWLRLAEHGRFTQTALTLLGAGSGWLALTPTLVGFALLIAVAVVALLRIHGSDTWLQAGVAVFVWGTLAVLAPPFVHDGSNGTALAALAVCAAGVAALAGLLWWCARGPATSPASA